MREDYQWFQENYANLQEKCGNCFLAIKGKRVIGTYDTYSDAVRGTEKTEASGTFIIQECRRQGPIFQAHIASMNFSQAKN